MIVTLFKILSILHLFYLVAAFPQSEGYKPYEEEIKCPDGTLGVVEHIQAYSEEPFQAAIFKVDCSAAGGWHTTTISNTTSNNTSPNEIRDVSLPELEKRQSNLCSSTCSTQCYGGTGTPTVSDCTTVANNLAGTGKTYTVNGGQKLVARSGTCLFRFTNSQYGSVTWCDSYWASQSRSMASQCLPQTPGALCTGSAYSLDVCLDPDAPAPPVYQTPPTTSAGVGSSTGTITTPGPDTPGTSSTGSSGNLGSSASSISNGRSSSTQSRSTTSAGASAQTLGVPDADLPGDSAAISQSVTDEEVRQKRGTSTAAIVGGVLGALVLLAILAAFFVWRRRSKARKDPIEASNDGNRPNSVAEINLSTESHGNAMTSANPGHTMVAAGRVLPDRPWNSKATLARDQYRTFNPQTEYSMGSSTQQLLSPTQDSSTIPDTPRTSRSALYSEPTDTSSVRQVIPIDDVARRSMSARTLAHAVAPDLSERDIRRLADSIVARMQVGAPLVAPDSAMNSTVATSAIGVDDPPPPWRASWSSNRSGSRPPECD